MPRPCLKTCEAVVGSAVGLLLSADLFLDRSGAPGIRLLQAATAMGVLVTGAVLIPLWVARRREDVPQARDPRSRAVRYMAGAIAVPALVALPLLVAFYLGCLPSGIVGLADEVARRYRLVILLYFQAALAPPLCWFLWSAGKPDSGAPCCRRRARSVRDSTALRLPERALGRDEQTYDRPSAGSYDAWGGLLRPWLAVSLVILVAGAALTAPFLFGPPGSRGMEALQRLGALSAMAPAAGAIWTVYRGGSLLHARDRRLRVAARMLGALAAPAAFMLPLLAAFHLGWRPPRLAQLADEWGLLAVICLAVYLVALIWSLRWWMKSRVGGRDPDAPRCPRCGYSLKGGAGLGCPECGWQRVAS
jgi:hypothetical protein